MRRHLLLPSLLLVLLCAGCAPAHLTGKLPPVPPDRGEARVVVIEPFFEDADWLVKTQYQNEQVITPYGDVGNIVVSRQVAEKPVFARLPILANEQRGVIAEMRRLRPSWKVLTTGDLPAASGPVSLIRVIVGPTELAGSNRALKNLACGFGFLLPPLWLLTIGPVEEVQRVHGSLQRFEADAAELRARLLRYPTQPDFAVDTRGLTPVGQPFGIDLEYQEGFMANELAREPVLVSGFIQRLAAATVALVEGGR